MDDVTVRWFRPEDAQDIVRLHAENMDYFEEEQPLTPEFVIESSKRSDFRFMVAERGGKVVGFTGALFYSSVGRAELGPISVGKNQQNHGAGNKLVASMLDFLKSAGIHRVVAHVKASNSSAINFFLSCGFYVEANLREYTMKREDAVQLAVLLN
ncbi:MAG: GNAT family N-acetyltransferase [Candidatus Altiarchaeota archaeon]|nr:GNAT family N-acetyltransferase [Candidatus Altiarchaeota archaeon]